MKWVCLVLGIVAGFLLVTYEPPSTEQASGCIGMACW